jgi:2-oxoacid:acceptor oxidoreductase delta subunit (pyruvate/2-ketoisovalerate family)
MRFRSPFEGAWADPDSLLVVRTGDWRLERPVVREARCSHCGLCWLWCPNNCIRDHRTHFAADLTYCKGCGVCARVCPAAAIVMREEDGA